jgi:hypothetical protein
MNRISDVGPHIHANNTIQFRKKNNVLYDETAGDKTSHRVKYNVAESLPLKICEIPTFLIYRG